MGSHNYGVDATETASQPKNVDRGLYAFIPTGVTAMVYVTQYGTQGIYGGIYEAKLKG